MLQIVTCCNDARIEDLARLTRSIARHAPDAQLRVIPFDDDIAMTERFVAETGGVMMKRQQVWTDLGLRLFHGKGHYRPGIPMWMYFHKLNMFNDVTGPTLYLDANSVLLSGETPPMPAAGELLFHSTAMKQRNIAPAAEYIRLWAPDIGEGFNLGYCHFGPEAASLIRKFAEILPGFHASFLGPAPEQSFLMYAIAFLGIKGRLLHNLDTGIAPTNNSNLPIVQDPDGVYRFTQPPFQGMRLLSAKRPGAAAMTRTQNKTFGQFE